MLSLSPAATGHCALAWQRPAIEAVLAGFAGIAPMQAPGWNSPALAEQAQTRLGQKFVLPRQPPAAGMPAGAAAFGAQGIAQHAQGIVHFQTFHGRIQGIGHMAVACIRAGAVRSSAHAARQCFVIVPAPAGCRIDIAHCDVIHRALARRRYPLRQRLGQGAENQVHQAHRGFHIARRHRRRRVGIKHRTLPRSQADGPEQAVTDRRLFGKDAAKAIKRGSRDHGFGAIQIASHLIGAGGKIERRTAIAQTQTDFERNRLIFESVIVQKVAEPVFTWGEFAERVAGNAFGIVIELDDAGAVLLQPQPLQQSAEPGHANLVGPGLGGEIPAQAVFRSGQSNMLLQFTGPIQQGRRDYLALFGQRFRQRHRTGRIAADIGVMGAIGSEAGEFAGMENRRDQGDVGQVRAAEIWVVEHKHVAVDPIESAHHITHGVGHAAEMHGDMRGLGIEPAFGVE